MSKYSLRDWMQAGLHLPPILRDFHDQKDVFKAIDGVVTDTRKDPDTDRFMQMILDELPGWTTLHIYVIDFFLWYMARRGYTLQRSMQRLEFVEYNPYKELSARLNIHIKTDTSKFDESIARGGVVSGTSAKGEGIAQGGCDG